MTGDETSCIFKILAFVLMLFESWDSHLTVAVVVCVVLTAACLMRRMLKQRTYRIKATQLFAVYVLEALRLNLEPLGIHSRYLPNIPFRVTPVSKRQRQRRLLYAKRMERAKLKRLEKQQRLQYLSRGLHHRKDISSPMPHEKRMELLSKVFVYSRAYASSGLVMNGRSAQANVNASSTFDAMKNHFHVEKEDELRTIYSLVPVPTIPIYIARAYPMPQKTEEIESYV